MDKKFLPMLFAVLFFLMFAFGLRAGSDKDFSPYADNQGHIRLPRDYRAAWSYLGAFVVPDEKAEGYGFHDVFTQPSTVKAYKETGKYPDGAVLVKEIRTVKTGKMTTGEASWAGDIKAWFVMVKDAQGRFKGNPNWGDGWGWAKFNVDAPNATITKNYKTECIGCHSPVKNTDFIHVEGYPQVRN